VIGHDVKLSETNAHGWVWVCQCGEVGQVVPCRYAWNDKNRRHQRNVELTKSIALDAHKLHTHEVRAAIARDSDRRLAAIGSDIKAANATLQRRGRYGHS
jgi:hypothetical protein